MKTNIGFGIEIETRKEGFLIDNKENDEELMFTKSGSRYRL